MRQLIEKAFDNKEDIVKEEEKKVKFLVPVAFVVRDGKVINTDTNSEDADLQAFYDFLEEQLVPEPELTEGDNTEETNQEYTNY